VVVVVVADGGLGGIELELALALADEDEEEVVREDKGGCWDEAVRAARQERGNDEERESRIHAARARVWAGKLAWSRYSIMIGIDGRQADAEGGIRFARYVAGSVGKPVLALFF
jgi:hypothetical protein